MRILVLGKTGQVGRALVSELRGHDVTFLGRSDADLSEPSTLAPVIAGFRPRVIVNAAAYTAVDKAETESVAAFKVNSESVEQIAAVTRQLDAWLIHYSTDYVFDGTKPSPYVEADQPAPLNVYGQSKLSGERAIAQAGARHVIFRTSWVHGAGASNFMTKILDLAATRDELSVVDDQIGAPTSAALIARMTRQAIDMMDQGSDLDSGVYHLTAAGETTWHGYASHLVACALDQGINLRVSPAQIRPVSSSAFPTPARRPLNSRLATDKLQSAFGVTLPSWQSDVHETLDGILARRSA